MNKNNIDISVCMITYNHEKYIEEALKSVIIQKGTFEVEIVIGIDKSDDQTYAICEKIQKKFNSKNRNIRIITSNQRVGMSNNLRRTLSECNGKYIAFLEGDDFWTSTTKLLTQKNFLDKNTNVDICGTLFSTQLVEKNKTINPTQKINTDYFSINFDYACIQNPFGTLTVMVKKNNLNVPEWIWNMPYIDWPLYCSFLLENKKGYILNLNTATYRLHNNGVFGRQKQKDKIINTDIILSAIHNQFKYNFNKTTLRIIKRKIHLNKKELFYINKTDNGKTIKTLLELLQLLKASLSNCKLKESKKLINYYLFH